MSSKTLVTQVGALSAVRLLRAIWTPHWAALLYCQFKSLFFSQNKQQRVTNTYSDETGSGAPELCCRDNVPPSRSSASVCKNYSGTLHDKRPTIWLVYIAKACSVLKFLVKNTLWKIMIFKGSITDKTI